MTATQPWPGLSRRHLLASPFALATAARAQPVPALPPPPVVDHSALFGPVKQQGDRSTCAYFAVTALVEAALARLTGLPQPLSEQYLTDIAHAGRPLPADETTDIGSVMELAQTNGMVPEAVLPYRRHRDGGQPIQPPPAALLAQGRHLQLRFRFSNTRFGRNGNVGDPVATLVQRLAKQPLSVALPYPKDEAGWDDDGLVHPAAGWQPIPQNAIADTQPKHFVVLTGYDQRARMVFLRSSWGASWGKAGYGRISFDTLAANWWDKTVYLLKTLTIA
ncbi:MAG: C1 family peptidase [Sphingomonadales bacterium]